MKIFYTILVNLGILSIMFMIIYFINNKLDISSWSQFEVVIMGFIAPILMTISTLFYFNTIIWKNVK